MNLLLLTPDDFVTANEAKVSDRRFEHLIKIIKPTINQQLDVGLLNGKTGSGKIMAINSHAITLDVTWTHIPPAPAPITLILALPRPLMLKRILQTLTAMGVKHIHLMNSQRVEKSFWGSSDMADDVIHHQLILGLEQSRDTVLPTIQFHKHFKTFVSRDVPALIHDKQALIAHLGQYLPCPANVQQHTVLAVGPEGGFIDTEIDAFISAGFQPIQIGTRPLRVEAAVTALLGRLLPV